MTRESALLAIQYALVYAINHNAHLETSHNCAAYDYVPQEVALATDPYIQIGDPTEVPWDFIGTCASSLNYGNRVRVRLHIWSTYRGKKECDDIITHLKELFDDQALTITGFNQVSTRSEFTSVMQDPDMLHYHGVLDLVLYVTQAT